MISVPPATPGPVPPVPEKMLRPSARPRLSSGMLVPRVSVIAPSTVIFRPAHRAIFPSVVVIAPSAFRFRLWPAFSRILPLVVVRAASTLMSRPQQTLKFPPTAVTAPLMLVSRNEVRLSVVGAPLATQLTGSLTMMSPFPVPGIPGSVLIATLVVTSSVDRAAPVILSPGADPITKSCGSIVQVPVWPRKAWVVTLACGTTFTVAAEVSIWPPAPPFGALASSVPPTLTVPDWASPNSLITPAWSSIVCASITPVLLTTVFSSSPAARAVITTWPPFA
jgi:hypothetical protein